MLSHYYGVNGGELKRLDTKQIVFDYELLQHMANNEFVENLRTCFNKFIDVLKEEESTAGSYEKQNKFTKMIFFSYCNNFMFRNQLKYFKK